MRSVLLVFLILAGPLVAATVDAPSFSAPRGFHDAAFDLVLASTTAGATVVYTLDGSAPSPVNGTVVAGPVAINRTSVVRAMAWKDGMEPSRVKTRTFLFTADIILQCSDGNRPTPVVGRPPWPANWSNGTNSQVAYYRMHPNVVGRTGMRSRTI